jgi:Fe-S-cluster containining protein
LKHNINYLADLLTPQDCANCKLCCWFSNYEIWETPAIDDELRAFILEKFPETRFIERDGYSQFVLNPLKTDSSGEYFACSMLTETGCALGADKPFECAVWPFRIMRLDDKYVISVSALCKPMLRNSLEKIMETLGSGLEAALIDHYAKNPAMIKKYTDGYPIIKFIGDTDLIINHT